MGKRFTDIKGIAKGRDEILLKGGAKKLKFLGFKVSPSRPTEDQLRLPDGVAEVWVHSPWFSIPVEAIDPREIVKIDAWICDSASIGFRAEKLVPVVDRGGKPLFWD